MSTAKPTVIELLRDLKQIIARIPGDFGGDSPLSKIFIMAYLALEYNLKNYVEIGVYKGRSFFPMAYVAKLLNGVAYGIDAYDYEIAKEHDLEDISQKANDLLASLNFLQINEDVKNLRQDLAVTDNSEIIQEESGIVIDYFRENNIAVDMLHIDGNRDTKQVLRGVELYTPLIRDGGLIVFDDVNRDSVKPVFNQLREKYGKVFYNGKLAIFSTDTSKKQFTLLQKHRLNILHSLVENATEPKSTGELKVSVVVITYNQEKYIAECLEGIFSQKGDFTVELVVGDDCSTDATLEVIRNYAANFGNDRFDVKILTTDKNIGMTKNLQRSLAACTGEYIAPCEGDDYWIDSYKLQKQVNFLKYHSECALCFNDFYMYFQEKGECTLFDLQQNLEAEVITTKEIVLNNFIGNFSCCMYDARIMKKIPSSLFDLYIADWMFNICYSRFGDIGHLREPMSVYRKHKEGVWTGRASGSSEPRDVYLHALIEEYNRFLNYDLDREFSTVQKRIEITYPDYFDKEPLDIAIIDDSFPHPLSAFRMQEFTSYLKEFDNLRIYSTGESLTWLGQKTLDELFRDFKRRFPEYAQKIQKLEPDTIINTKLFYLIFLGNTYRNIEMVEKLRTPFVFMLYPGSVFGLNNARSDMMLKRVTSSPCFRKVLVSQKVTYDYLIEKKFCTPEQVEFIFGVVTPLELMDAEYTNKKHFGVDKNVLDICFVAHKYTETGIDKGYDVFVDTAKELYKKYDNIQFHVVGGFDKNVIDVADLKERITFYGRKEMEWFNEFYKDKDIILSPNIPFMNPGVEGSFDGFPTASCVDAGLRKTAIFCTDELHLNTQFDDREEIVIIPHDASRVTKIIEYYYQNPEKLKSVAENGCRKIKRIYGYESQILPRIKILREQVKQAKRIEKGGFSEIGERAIPEAMKTGGVKLNFRQRLGQIVFSAFVSMKRRSPAWLKDLLRKGFLKIRSNEALFAFIKRMLPGFLIRILVKVQESV